MNQSTDKTSSSGDCGCEMIHEDLLFRILLWLPVAALLRFKSVCKSWLSLISNSHFISRHAREISSLEEADKLCFADALASVVPYFFFNYEFLSIENLQMLKHIDFSPTDALHDRLRFMHGRLIASYDGVICLRHVRSPKCYKEGLFPKYQIVDEDVVSLWNPATMQFTILPPPHSKFIHYAGGQTEYGFGFDVKANDYKVVRIVVENHQEGDAFKSQVEVYSLKMDSWSVIDVGLPLNLHFTSNPNRPFTSEVYCWGGYEWNSELRFIISFDFSNQMFGIIPAPDIVTNVFRYLTLSFLKDKIACIDWTYEDPMHRDVWVLNEFGIQGSWTKLYTITLGKFDRILGFSTDGKIILIKIDSELKRTRCIYDPHTQKLSELPSQGTSLGISEAAKVAVYKESLISVKSANGVTRRAIYEDLESINLEDKILLPR